MTYSLYLSWVSIIAYPNTPKLTGLKQQTFYLFMILLENHRFIIRLGLCWIFLLLFFLGSLMCLLSSGGLAGAGGSRMYYSLTCLAVCR